ncbi:MAG: hypothetical protein AVDCRST_MAG50-920 [uncultured Acidimicrobiales bacterium]|uniref:Uncharacterized protein n=1 Tax=uncultured Acidimicrobiales bacterium TaxID=310071 RepID=A0A6J4GYL4_9ACTN|nr:MAG: hypothetical protein AVDCRST_MAG50-920 [uncultured Acidimicrobiales bacterium]
MTRSRTQERSWRRQNGGSSWSGTHILAAWLPETRLEERARDRRAIRPGW